MKKAMKNLETMLKRFELTLATYSEESLKKAYKKLARKYHPDLHPNDEGAKKMFQELTTDYTAIQTWMQQIAKMREQVKGNVQKSTVTSKGVTKGHFRVPMYANDIFTVYLRTCER